MRTSIVVSLLCACSAVASAALYEVLGDVTLLSTAPNINADIHASALATNTIDDRALLLWQADYDDGDGYRIWAASIGMAPPLVVYLFPVLVDDNSGVVRDVTAVFHPVAERYLIVWSQAVGGAFEIWGRLMARDYEFVGPQFQISTMGLDPLDPAFDAGRPAVTVDANGLYFVVVWEGDDDGNGHSDGQFDIFARRVRADGVLSGNGRQRITSLGLGGGDALAPAIAYRPASQEFWVVYEGDTDGGLHEPQVYLSILDEQGIPKVSSAQPSLAISTLDSDKGGVVTWAKNPDLAYDTRNDQCLVVWDGTSLEPGEEAVYARLLTGSGSISPISRISADGVGGLRNCAARDPRIQYNLVADGFVVAWSGSIAPSASCPTEFEIMAREVDRDGVAVGGPAAISTTDTADPNYEAVSVAVASSANNQSLLATWSGSASTPFAFDYFAQYLSLDRATAADEPSDLPRVLEFAAAPNPFNPRTNIAFGLPAAGRARIAIYDVRGALVRTLLDEPMDAGRFERSWDGRDDRGNGVASGVYFVQLDHPLGHREQKLILLK